MLCASRTFSSLGIQKSPLKNKQGSCCFGVQNNSNLLPFMGEMFQENVESRNVYWLERLMETSQLGGHMHCARQGLLECN